jgi:hypothetical protein
MNPHFPPRRCAVEQRTRHLGADPAPADEDRLSGLDDVERLGLAAACRLGLIHEPGRDLTGESIEIV